MTSSMLRLLTAEELLERLAAIPDDVAPMAAGPVSLGRWRLRRAAVLRGFFRLRELTEAPAGSPGTNGDDGSDEDKILFVREDCQRARTPRGARWQLSPEIRRATVAHLEHRADLLLETLAGVPEDPLDVGRTMARAYLQGNAPPLAEQTLEHLTGTRLAVEWLAGVRTDLPAVVEVEATTRLATLLAPLRIVLDGPVRGRERELHQLRQFAHPGGLAGHLRPLVISGPGGMGKSALLATFLLHRNGRASARDLPPFAYLTFDRADLAPQMPLTVLAEVLRQLAVQFPTHASRCAQVANQLEETQVNISAVERDVNRSRGTVDVWRRWQRDVELLVQEFARATDAVTAGPVICILDTFERAQRQGPGPVGRLWDLLAQVEYARPGLRVIVAGRGGVPDREVEPLELGGLHDDAARAVLRDRLGGRTIPSSLLDVVVRRSRGNPLTLRLAAELTRRQDRSLDDPSARRRFLEAFDEVEVQGVLYQRVLDHVDAPEARALAVPGLVLRLITVDLVRDVLARSAGLGGITTADARRLYDILRAESSLVTERDGALVHRQDVRAQVLPIIERDEPTLVASVHRRAVAFYRARTRLEDRTEELYHRLALGQGRRTLESRWDDGAGVPLYSVLQEEHLEPQVHAWLANKLGMTVDEEVLRQVDDAAWLGQAIRTGRSLLDAGRPEEALEVLRRRRPERLDLTLAELEVEALARSGRPQQAQDLAEEAIAVAADRRDAAVTARFLTLAAQLAEDSGDFARALVLLAEARSYARQSEDVVQETALGAGVLRLLRRQGLAADAATVELREEVVRLAQSLTRKQRTSSPALVRDLAAEIGQEAPEFVLEAAHTVGIDVTSAQSREKLSAHRKEDVAARIREILHTDEARDALPGAGGNEDTEFTSHAQGEAIGNYLEVTSDAASSSDLSEYFQVESDARAFGDE